MTTQLYRTTQVLFAIVLSLCILAQPYMAAAQAQLNSASFELDVRGAGGTGADGAGSASFGLENSAGPVFTLTDVTPPTVPGGLGTTSVAATAIAISWIASTDDVGVAGYEVYRNGVSVGTVGGTSFSDSGLTASTAYTYEIVAYDAAGNRSATSTPLSETTPTAPVTNSGSGGGGGSPNLADPDTPEDDPEEDNGVAITQLAPSDTRVTLSGEVLSGTDMRLYFVVSDSQTEPSCTAALTRYSVPGLKSEGDAVSLTVYGLHSGTRHYARLCGQNADGDLVVASAVDSFKTTNDGTEVDDVSEVVEGGGTAPGGGGTDPLNPDADNSENPDLTNPNDPGADGDEGGDENGENVNGETGESEDVAGGEVVGEDMPDINEETLTPAEAAELTPEERFEALEREEIEEHEIGYVNDGEVFSATQPFENGSEVSVTVWPNSVLDADGNPVGPDVELIIVISEHFLPLELSPEFDLKAVSIGGVIFEVRVFDTLGNEYHRFDPDLMLEIDIAWPEGAEIPDGLGLYFLERGDAGWTQIPDAVFDGTTVLFGVDHLTVFGAWGVTNTPGYMPLEDGVDANGKDLATTDLGQLQAQTDRALQCGIIFGFIPTPNCWPWWVWVALIMIAYLSYRKMTTRD